MLVLMKIYPVVNVSRITIYQKQVEEQKKILSLVLSQIEEIYNRRRHLREVGKLGKYNEFSKKFEKKIRKKNKKNINKKKKEKNIEFRSRNV